MCVELTKEEIDFVVLLNENPSSFKKEDLNFKTGRYSQIMSSISFKISNSPRYSEIRAIPNLTLIEYHELLVKELKEFNNYQG